MADPDVTSERQRVRLGALTFAGLASVVFIVALALAVYVVAVGCAAVAVAAGTVSLRMYSELHAEELARDARQRATGRVVAHEPPPAQYGPST